MSERVEERKTKRQTGRWAIHKEFALYKGDDLITMGTVPEIAKEMGVNEHTIRFYGMPVHYKRASYDSYFLVDLDDEED